MGVVTTPSLAELKQLAAADPSVRRVAIARDYPGDTTTTTCALRALRAASRHCFLLESAEANKRAGRYSFIGYDPALELTCQDGTLRVRHADGTIHTHQVDHPADAVREVLAAWKTPRMEGLPPFAGGLVGYVSYDYLAYSEPVLRRPTDAPARDNDDFLDLDLMLFDKVVCFDTYRQRMVVMALVDVSDPALVDKSYAAAEASIEECRRIIDTGEPYEFEPLTLVGEPALRRSREEFAQMVREAKRHIVDGDIFQVVLSNPTTCRATGSLMDSYRLLRSSNPSPYMFYFTSDSVEIAGASPETLVKLVDGRLTTYPLAGTRPRGATPSEDERLERELLADAKELAEHNMLVDLGRNDLGRVAQLGSVRVERLQEVLRFSHVMHLGSEVSATLAPGCDALDAIDAVLPAGTLSGAPKIRACQIIDELEDRGRGIYGGAVGYLDLSGNMDLCIGIRLAYKRGDEVCVQSGAGIVADSVPEREYDECRNKARAVLDAIVASQGGIDK